MQLSCNGIMLVASNQKAKQEMLPVSYRSARLNSTLLAVQTKIGVDNPRSSGYQFRGQRNSHCRHDCIRVCQLPSLVEAIEIELCVVVNVNSIDITGKDRYKKVAAEPFLERLKQRE